jgi:hypothetical protein
MKVRKRLIIVHRLSKALARKQIGEDDPINASKIGAWE